MSLSRNQRKAQRRKKKLSRKARKTSIPYQSYQTATEIFIDRRDNNRHKRTKRRIKNFQKRIEEMGLSVIPSIEQEESAQEAS